MRILIIFFAAMLSGCAADMIRIKKEDPNDFFSRPEGSFSVSCNGAPSLVSQRYDNGVTKAKKFCGDKIATIIESGSSSRQESALVPTQQTYYHQGTFSTGTTYSGTTQTNQYVPVNYTSTTYIYDFICEDPDMEQKIYALKFDPTEVSAPICDQVISPYNPGTSRINSWKDMSSSDDYCPQEGWLRVLNRDTNAKVHIFIGVVGRRLCDRLEREVVSKNITGQNLNMFLRKRLICKPDKDKE